MAFLLLKKIQAVSATKVALRDVSGVLSYGELNQKSDSLAAYLTQKKKIKSGDCIPVLMHKTNHLIVVIVAIFKAGGCYVPIAHDASSEFVLDIIKQTEAEICITEPLLAHLFETNVPSSVLSVNEAFFSQASSGSAEKPVLSLSVSDDAPAYIMYTSGSSGKPKGVIVTYNNLEHVLTSWKKTYELCERDIHLQMANITFDVFMGDLFRALGTGATLVLCKREILLSPDKLYSLLVAEKISVAEFVPSVLRSLLTYLKEHDLKISYLRLLICGSDQWSFEEYCSVKQYCSFPTRIINSYGLTEATIDSTYFEESMLAESALHSSCITPIGKPLPHVEIFILNEELQPVIRGEIGEIYIAGPSISVGYLKQPAMTRKRFLFSPQKPKLRMFRTGDSGYQLEDGNIILIGRNAFHLKINGQRLTLQEIEFHFKQHCQIDDCFIEPDDAEPNSLVLDIYCLCSMDTSNLTYEHFSDYLHQKWPFFNIKCKFYLINEIPLSTQGKVQRLKLPQMVIGTLLPCLLPPKSPLEKEILTIWQELLMLKDIGINTNFFDAGGTSLLAMVMLERIKKYFYTDMLCSQIEVSTIESLIKEIERRRLSLCEESV